MGATLILVLVVCFSFIPFSSSAGKAACHNPMYGTCYGINHNCPASCPTLCEVNCRLCKPYCACDKPGAVCQDPRFIGGDGIMFYFHGRREQNFCLVTDSKFHINARFIGKRSKKGRDFTWVQSIGILFGPHRLHIGAQKVSKWQESVDSLQIHLNGEEITLPTGERRTWESPKKELTLKRIAETNKVEIKVQQLFKIVARVVPITPEESAVHGYDISEEDCYAHLELNFKFEALTAEVDGVLGQTYRPNYHSRVKMAAAMPIMGGQHKFSSSHLFATDCAVSGFGLRSEV